MTAKKTSGKPKPVSKPVVKATAQAKATIPATPAEVKPKPAAKPVDPKATARPPAKKTPAAKAPPKSSTKQGVGAGVPKKPPTLPSTPPPVTREEASGSVKSILDQASSASVKVIKKIDTRDIGLVNRASDTKQEPVRERVPEQTSQEKQKPAKLDFADVMAGWRRDDERDRARTKSIFNR